MRSRQLLRLPARLCDHPVREGRHEARSLGEREEIGRRHETFAVLPADERLGADDLGGVEADERLVVEDEAVAALDRRAQAPGHRKLRERVVAVERIEGMAVAARVLRAVHRSVRVLQESLRVGRVVGEEADADRGADEDLHAGDDEGSQQRAADLPRDDRGGLAGVLGVVLVAVRLDVGEEDEELVASLAGDHVGGARRALKPSRDRAESSSPAAWPKLSLISLKLSRSMKRTPAAHCFPWQRSSASSSRSWKETRLGRPVSGSWKAMCWSWRRASSRASEAFRRSVMSATIPSTSS